MVSCRICLEALKKPVSLPCGHIFCCDCVIKTVQAIQPYTHLHPCPICRTMYNITPANMSVVPPNLRSFVTPSIRRVYIDDMGPTEGSAEPEKEFSLSEASCSPSESSELARLRAENHALRNNCLMWRKRAETHGAANLGLLNFARVVRDQASILARERDELRRHCSALKRKIDDIDDQ
ncbi:hypothetical protein CPC08DRAFT_636975 [Agrocybe pediades]|nr:hypothetical protein CPC08DRAFT_636975 [Agrocybe pediades]